MAAAPPGSSVAALAAASAPTPLVVALPANRLYGSLVLQDPLDPGTWLAATTAGAGAAASSGARRLAAEPREAEAFFEDTATAFETPLEAIYVSFRQDAAGRHFFVSLGEAAVLLGASPEAERGAADGRLLREFPESEVKELREKQELTLLYAQAALPATSMVPPPEASLSDKELCPRRSIWASNYSLIPDLALGTTQRLILCNENTLCREMPEERIFEYLTLIVNCHESRPNDGKYQIGSCGTDRRPQVIYQAVHQWFSLGAENMNRANDEIQEAIWDKLQTGTVAVHCLAGIHRAACIVACHFLWRHYILGHKHVPADPQEIYRRLQAVRPAVEPAYGHVLANYAKHLQKRAG